MARHADQQQLEELRQIIEHSPGQCIGAVARLLNWSREKVTRSLVTLNDRGVLFYEDERGRLWRYRKHTEVDFGGKPAGCHVILSKPVLN